MRAPPTRWRILRSDYSAQAIAIFVFLWFVMAATIGFGTSFKNPMLTAIFGGMTGLIVLVGGGFVLLRTGRLHHLYARGIAVEGKVLRLGENSESVQHAIIGYAVGGATFETRLVTGSAKYRVGDAVEVLVDPERPSRATVRLLR